jgi:hypothetical protein
MSHTCQHCNRTFAKETSLSVHSCEHKRRYMEQDEVGVQIGLQAYLKFYEMTQGNGKTKTWEQFVKSPYYRAFIKFGRYCQSIRAVNTPRFIEWLIKQNKKIDYWCRDAVYGEYLLDYLRQESITDALTRAIETAQTWQEETGNPLKDYLRYGNDNALCYAVTTGKISAWVLYNCKSGTEFLSRINQEQVAMIWQFIDADFWSKKFKEYPDDTEYVNNILKRTGW